MKSIECVAFATLFTVVACAGEQAARDVKETITDKNSNGKPDKLLKETYLGKQLVRSETFTDADEDGSPEMTVIKLFDAGTLVFVEILDRRLRSHTKVHYLGKARFTESDLNGDGFFEWAVMSPESGKRVFLHRSRAGAQIITRVVSEEEAKDIERTAATISPGSNRRPTAGD